MRHLLFAAILTAFLVAPAPAQEGCCPQVGPEHERLYYFIGEWTGEETWTASESCPVGGKGTCAYDAHRLLNGMFVEMAYSTRLEQGAFEGKAILGYDAAKKVYRMWWFDVSGACQETPIAGTWNGKSLVFEGTSECGGVSYQSRYTYEIKGHNEFVFRIECAATGGEYAEMMRSTVTRVGGRIATASPKKEPAQAPVAEAPVAPAQEPAEPPKDAEPK